MYDETEIERCNKILQRTNIDQDEIDYAKGCLHQYGKDMVYLKQMKGLNRTISLYYTYIRNEIINRLGFIFQ